MVCSVRNSSQIDLEALRRYGICQEKKVFSKRNMLTKNYDKFSLLNGYARIKSHRIQKQKIC